MPSPKDSSPGRGQAAAVEEAYSSPSLEVLGGLEIANTLSHLEARLDSIEIDLARVAGSREEDTRRVAGEMAVMKARVEDALNAVTATAEDLRHTWLALDGRLTDLVEAGLAEQHRAVEALRAQLGGGLEATRVAIAEAEARLRGEVEALSATDLERVRAVTDLVGEARARVDEAVAQMEGRLGEVLAGTRMDRGTWNEELHAVASRLREEVADREHALAERIGEVASRVSDVAASFDTLTTKVAGTEARFAGERAGTDVLAQGVTERMRALEARVHELAEAVATSSTGRLEALAGQVAEVREAILRVAERVGSTAFLTRRLADLELRVSDLTAKADSPASI